MAGFRIINKKEFLFTYATDYLGALTCKRLFNLFTKDLGKDWEVIVAKEHGDKANNHDHFHVYAKYIGPNTRGFSTRNQRYFYCPLDFNVVKIYNIESDQFDKPFYYEKEEDMLNEGQSWSGSTWSRINNAVVAKYGYAEWKPIDVSCYDVKYKGAKYGPECKSSITMIEYVLKNPIEDVLSNFDYKKRLEELKKEKKERKTPDWKWMKEQNFSANEALDYLKENYLDQFMKNWARWETPFYKLFSQNKDDLKVNLDAEYWLPNVVYNYLVDVYMPYYEHRHDRDWLRAHRLDRPKSLVWIGESKRGKTSAVRSLFKGNYYHTLIDGMVDFDENAPCVILDDFHINLKKFMPGWKGWLGCQTDFTVNPKYGKRRKIAWGHPCIFLNNDDFRECQENEKNIWSTSELDYFKENCVFINTGSMHVFKEPNELDKFRYVKVKVRDFRPDLVEEMEGSNQNEDDELNASDIDREYEVMTPTLIIDDDEATTSTPRLRKRKRSFEDELVRHKSTRSDGICEE